MTDTPAQPAVEPSPTTAPPLPPAGVTAVPAPTAAEVVWFFDELLANGVDIEALLDRTAAFVGAEVGAVLGGLATPAGTARPEGSAFRAITSGSGAGAANGGGAGAESPSGEVWTTLADEHLAGIVLERLAVAVRVIARWSAMRQDAAPRPIDVIVDRAAPQGARDIALEQLGLTHDALVRFVVCTGPADDIETLIERLAGERIIARTTHEARTVLLLAAPESGGIDIVGVPVGMRAAYGHTVPARQASVGFMNACDTHRFSRPSPTDLGPYRGMEAVWLNGARTSPLGALAHLDPSYIALLPDVQKLERLAERHGDRILHVLEAYATTDSMRKAAVLVFMHHNSVLYWVQKAEAELEYSLAEPYQRALLFISLCLHRIWRDQD